MADSSCMDDLRAAPALRWGILGPGGIARAFATDLLNHTASTVAAVGSRDRGRARAFADEFGAERTHGSYADLVADPGIDVVYVASPHSEHRDHAILALEAGKPVLVEKAFTRNAAEAVEVFSVAQARGLFVMEAMWSRFLPHYGQIRALIAAGEIGEPRSFTAQHAQRLVFEPGHRLWNPALAGGALLDLGVYPLSFGHYLFGVPSQLQAVGTLTRTGVDANETIAMWFGDVLGWAEATMVQALPTAASIIGSSGRIDVHGPFYRPTSYTLTSADGSVRDFEAFVPGGGMQFEAVEVARRIAAGERESPQMSWQATFEVMTMMDGARRQLGVVYPGESVADD